MKINAYKSAYLFKRTEILIYLANSTEQKAFYDYIGQNLKRPLTSISIDNTIIKFTKYNNYHLAIVLGNEVGSIPAISVIEPIYKYFPNLLYIVNIGCCASMMDSINANKQEVIFATTIFDGELRKELDENKKEYKHTTNNTNSLTNRIKNAVLNLNIKNVKLTIGPIISSSAIVNSSIYKNNLYNNFPYAEAIEMEGNGIATLAISKKIDWIILKGVSDNAKNKQGNKNQYQATQYASYVFFQLLYENIFPLNKMPIFIGGALKNNDKFKESNIINLAYALFDNNYKIINGYGLNVGNALIAAAYQYKTSVNNENIDNLIQIYPFPITLSNQEIINQSYKANRNLMINKSLISLFIYGRNTKKDKYNGLLDEYYVSSSNNLINLVIPSKGYYSKQLYDKKDAVIKVIDNEEFKKIYNSLETLSPSDKIKATIKLLKLIDDIFYL